MKEFNSNIENHHDDHPEGEFHAEYLEDFKKGQMDQDDDFNFLSEEEIASLDENEKYDYYQRLDKKSEQDESKKLKRMEEEAEDKAKDEYKESLDRLYEKDDSEPYWQR